MTSEKETHEWVLNASEYEAVLQCTHELQAWDTDATVRAFQTFNWSDATLQGEDEQRFMHEPTSVSVIFDGGTLAIEYAGLGVGLERMPEAFADLFPALSALGWKSAEVYHSPDTMNALLEDMGANIPAHLDFDLKPASPPQSLTPIPNSSDIVAMGRQILGTPAPGSASGALLEQMQAFGDEVENSHAATTHPTDPRSNYGPILLEDDEPTTLGQPIHSFTPISQPLDTADAMHTESFEDPTSDLDEAPQVFSLPVQSPAAGQPAPVTSFAPAQAPVTSVAASARTTTPTPPTAPSILEVLASKPAATEQRASLPAPPSTGESVVLPGILTLGASSFYFDTADTPPDLQQVEDFAAGFDTVIHLHPGVANSPVRWDLMAEIDPQTPAFAERLAAGLGFYQPETTFVANMLLAVKTGGSVPPQLRDVVPVEQGEHPAFASANARNGIELWSQLTRPKLQQSMDNIALRLGGFLLGRDGDAFVDIRQTEGQREQYPVTTFSVRELAQSSVSAFYFVHVDPLDGPSVRAIADLLQTLVTAHATTRRVSGVASTQVAGQGRKKEVQALKDNLMAEVQQVFAGIVERISAIA